jgi:hypothetical protein
MRYILFLSLAAALAIGGNIVNGGFELPSVDGTPGSVHDYGMVQTYSVAQVLGWETTDVGIEIWRNGQTYEIGPGNYITAYEGQQWAEINADTAGTLFQTILPTAGAQISFSFAHRGRASSTTADVVKVQVIDIVTNAVLLDQNYGDTNSAWGFYTESLGAASGNALQLRFQAISSVPGPFTAQGDLSFGNFIDDVRFGEAVPEPASMVLVGAGLLAAGFLRRKMS